MLRPQHVEELRNPSELITALLQMGLSVSFEAHGSSMLPAIRPGDKLLVEPVKLFFPGEVVLTMLPRGLTAHRVIHIDHDSGLVVTRGDNCSADDPPVSCSALLGKVTVVRQSAIPQPGILRTLVRMVRTQVAAMMLGPGPL